MKQGIFYPEFTLGAGALGNARRVELQHFLIDVIRRRGSPLHLANLWNTLYFNYDLDYGGFRAHHLDQRRIPNRTAEARAFSLPVGGFVRVHTQMACGDLLAEVIYKEGAHPCLDEEDGWIEAALSGAAAAVTTEFAGQLVAVVRERFVLDLSAFGPDGNCISAKQYERLCDRARWLDQHGHLLMEAMYDLEEANLEDLDCYAEYLVKEHRDGLLAFCFNGELSTVSCMRHSCAALKLSANWPRAPTTCAAGATSISSSGPTTSNALKIKTAFSAAAISGRSTAA